MRKDITPENFVQCPLPITPDDTIQLSHGSGGKMMSDLINKLFLWAFDNPHLKKLDDFSVLELHGIKLAMSTDSFVVDPLFFPGGNIGELAVHGTVNDLAMSGAKPLFLSTGLILEEGFPLDDLRTVISSMSSAAENAGVAIVTGDTKVVNKSKGDKIFINTTGIGIIQNPFIPSSRNIEAGDRIIVNGSIAGHGIAIMSKREGLSFETPIESDTAPLNGLIDLLVQTGGSAVHALRDPTRGGLAATLNEFAENSNVEIKIYEDRIPIQPPIRGACELLGLDPLYIANEGKVVVVVAPEKEDVVLQAMKSHPFGREAASIGEVTKGEPGRVSMKTAIGGWRILDMPVGEQLPRIC